MRTRRWRLATTRPHFEGVITGLAYATTLVALCVCAVGSFRPGELPKPYWPRLRSLRTDTFGVGCFVVATVLISLSEYLRLARDRAPVLNPGSGSPGLLAVAKSLTAAASVGVVYLSLNTITHPATLSVQATHLLSWPTEGTLRVIALAVTAGSAATVRTQLILKRARPSD